MIASVRRRVDVAKKEPLSDKNLPPINRLPPFLSLEPRPATSKPCPFCGKPSYSASGEHPQCSRKHAAGVLLE